MKLDSEFDEPIKLQPLFRERVWGRESLMPYFTDTTQGKRIGEVWYTCPENVTASGKTLRQFLTDDPEILGEASDARHPGVCPILVKLLFTSERLSVQVHPDDTYAHSHHASPGKTEAWYVLEAQPGAEVALGFRNKLSAAQLKAAAETGEIEKLLDWRGVRPGQIIFVPAGTVHAIGAGLTVCEIQQNSDVTYRLYDYGRPRELHLENGAAVAHLDCHEHEPVPINLAQGREELLSCGYFRIERLRIPDGAHIRGGLPCYLVLICLNGRGTINGEPCSAGDAWLVPANSREFRVEAPGSEWIATYAAEEAASNLMQQSANEQTQFRRL